MSDPPGGRPLCRDAYLNLMATYLEDLFTAGQARNLFIHGEPGSGKTVCVKYVLSEVTKHAAETKLQIQTAYVNAGKTRNPYYTMDEIVKQLGVKVPDAGWQMFRLKQAFESLLTMKSVLIAIDEVDTVIFKEKEPLVYYLSRQPRTTLILISNCIGDVLKLPEKTLSTLHPVLIEAEPYTEEEIIQILKERAEHTFQPGTINDDCLAIIARAVNKAGDIRFGFRVLLTAGLIAEKARKQTINTTDVTSAIKKERGVKDLKQLDAIQEQLLNLKKRYERSHS
ncbi:MAG TPA: AAA family ATPase [Candidatus Bathyarchaeia archaeon]|nr:AAA family ATPase [Candidatus Bathyarchaeia archaeon]